MLLKGGTEERKSGIVQLVEVNRSCERPRPPFIPQQRISFIEIFWLASQTLKSIMHPFHWQSLLVFASNHIEDTIA